MQGQAHGPVPFSLLSLLLLSSLAPSLQEAFHVGSMAACPCGYAQMWTSSQQHSVDLCARLLKSSRVEAQVAGPTITILGSLFQLALPWANPVHLTPPSPLRGVRMALAKGLVQEACISY